MREVDLPQVVYPPDASRWNRAIRGAFRKGWEAGVAGWPASACPYTDERTRRNAITWSRSFIRAWHDGHDAALEAIHHAA